MSALFAVIIVVAIIVVAAGLSVYIAEGHLQTSSSAVSTSSNTSTSSTTASYSSTSRTASSSFSSSSITTPSTATTSRSQTSASNSSSILNSSSPPQWPMFQYNAQHTGQSPYSAVSNPALKWVKNYGVGGFPSYSGVPSSYRTVSPVIGSDGTIYMVFQNRSGLLAIWPDGNIRWRLNFCCSAGDDVIFSTERILYATSGANLLAINPLDGSVISNKTAPFGNEA